MVIKTETFEGREVTYAICEAVAEQTDTDIYDLPPLYETIDPDAIDALLRWSDSTDVHPRQSVEFSYCGYRVTVDSIGRIQLTPEADSACIEDTKELYTEDEILPKLETAMADSSGEIRSSIRAAIKARKKELRDREAIPRNSLL